MLQPILNQIIEKADGLPLFIEELTNSILTSMRSRVADSALAQTLRTGCAQGSGYAVRRIDGTTRPGSAGSQTGADRRGDRA